MAERCKFPTRRSLRKNIDGVRVQIGRGCDITNGYNYFVYAVNSKGRVQKIAWGINKNKFTAIREALNQLK